MSLFRWVHLVLAAGLVLPASLSHGAEPQEALRVGSALPWIAGWPPDDRVINRTSLLNGRTSPLVIVMFATWCRPCEVELKALAQGRLRLQAARVELLLVNVGEDGAKVPPWLAARGLGDIPLVIDRFGQIGRALGVITKTGGTEATTLPRTLVVDPKGRVLALLGDVGGGYIDAILRVLPAQKAP